MSQAPSEMLKLAAGLIVILMAVTVVFGGENSMFNDSFKYMTYGESLLLQRHIVSLITTANTIPGDYYGRIILKGDPYTINFYEVEGVYYVSVDTEAEEYHPSTQIDYIEPMAVETDCSFTTPTVLIPKDVSKILNFRKTVDEAGNCALSFTVSM